MFEKKIHLPKIALNEKQIILLQWFLLTVPAVAFVLFEKITQSTIQVVNEIGLLQFITLVSVLLFIKNGELKFKNYFKFTILNFSYVFISILSTFVFFTTDFLTQSYEIAFFAFALYIINLLLIFTFFIIKVLPFLFQNSTNVNRFFTFFILILSTMYYVNFFISYSSTSIDFLLTVVLWAFLPIIGLALPAFLIAKLIARSLK